jgi:hypothetical protein
MMRVWVDLLGMAAVRAPWRLQDSMHVIGTPLPMHHTPSASRPAITDLELEHGTFARTPLRSKMRRIVVLLLGVHRPTGAHAQVFDLVQAKDEHASRNSNKWDIPQSQSAVVNGCPASR